MQRAVASRQHGDSRRPLRRPNLNSDASDAIRDAILSGELKPGDQIYENAWADRLSVSRTPVKIALVQLAEDGLVDLVPRKGAFVRGFSATDLRELYQVRESMEVLAVRLAAERADKDWLAEMHDINNELLEISEKHHGHVHRFNGDTSAYDRVCELDTGFHDRLVLASGNRLLERIMSKSHMQLYSIRWDPLYSDDVEVGPTAVEHESIMRALEARRPDEAEAVLRAHMARVTQQIERIIENGLPVSGNSEGR